MEKETAEAVAKAVVENQGIVAAAFASVVGGIGWLWTKVYNSLGHRINNARQAATSANALAVKVGDNLVAHMQRDEEMHAKVLEAMTKQTEKLGDIHAALQRDLGDRPTRDEMRELFQQARS